MAIRGAMNNQYAGQLRSVALCTDIFSTTSSLTAQVIRRVRACVDLRVESEGINYGN